MFYVLVSEKAVTFLSFSWSFSWMQLLLDRLRSFAKQMFYVIFIQVIFRTTRHSAIAKGVCASGILNWRLILCSLTI